VNSEDDVSCVKAQVIWKADGMRKPGDTGSSTEEKPRVVDHASSSSNWNETAEYRSDSWSSS